MKKDCTKCTENCKNMGMQDIIEYVREFFEIHEHVSDETLRIKIKSVIGEGAWNASERKMGEKRIKHFFSQDELHRIIYDPSLYGYLLERASERSRVSIVQGAEFRAWWDSQKIGAEGFQSLASKLVDLAYNLCNDVYAEGHLPPLPKVDCEGEEKIEILFELLKKALMFYPQYADRFGGECGAAAQTEEERLAERVSGLVAEKLAPMLASADAKPQTRPPEAKPPISGKHGTFRD